MAMFDMAVDEFLSSFANTLAQKENLRIYRFTLFGAQLEKLVLYDGEIKLDESDVYWTDIQAAKTPFAPLFDAVQEMVKGAMCGKESSKCQK